ncbi:hypothetical protein M0R45_026202 [Rubus argutus]|uniref:Uncharacterized protein n=1 Tax=Rubus argutus TaxID=59490 RepID=A0AAW1WWX6_RUBAR
MLLPLPRSIRTTLTAVPKAQAKSPDHGPMPSAAASLLRDPKPRHRRHCHCLDKAAPVVDAASSAPRPPICHEAQNRQPKSISSPCSFTAYLCRVAVTVAVALCYVVSHRTRSSSASLPSKIRVSKDQLKSDVKAQCSGRIIHVVPLPCSPHRRHQFKSPINVVCYLHLCRVAVTVVVPMPSSHTHDAVFLAPCPEIK